MVHPYIVIKINILMSGYIIISIYIGHVIITCVVITNRAPGRLAANV